MPICNSGFVNRDPKVIYARTLSGEWRCRNPFCNVKPGELHRCEVRFLQRSGEVDDEHDRITLDRQIDYLKSEGLRVKAGG